MKKHLSYNLKHKNVLIYFRKHILILLIIFITVYLSSCEQMATEAGVNCLFDDYKYDVYFETDSLPTAIINQEYSANIVVSVTNLDTSGGCYDYDITVEEGYLPIGLDLVTWEDEREHWYDFASDETRRTVKIKGTPIEAPGEYKFRLEVYVYVGKDCTDLCTHLASKYYVITLNSE
jgi:hypothetical protein